MKKILLLLLFCVSGVALYSQIQNTYLSKMSDTLFKQSMIRNMDNHYMLWDEREDSLAYTDFISDYLALKLFDSAEMSIRKVSKLSVDKAFFPFSMCVCKMAEHQYDSAFYYANQTLLVDPFHRGALYNKAYIYYYAGRFDQAENICDQLINLDSDNPESYFLKAELFLASGKFIEAVGLLKTIENLVLIPEQKLAVCQMLANAYLQAIYLKNERFRSVEDPLKNAQHYVQKCLELDTNQVYNYYLRTRVNYILETDIGYKSIVDDYERIARLDSNLRFTCNIATANCLFYLRKPKEAVELLNTSIDDMGKDFFNILTLNDLILVGIIRQMRDLPLYQHEENAVYFDLLSGALSLRFSKRELSRIIKKVNENTDLSLLATRFNVYFSRSLKFKLHMQEYGNYMTFCEFASIFKALNISDSFENVDLMWLYALSLEFCPEQTDNSDVLVDSAYQRVLAFIPKNMYFRCYYTDHMIADKTPDEAIAYIRKETDETKKVYFHAKSAFPYFALEEMDRSYIFTDTLLANEAISLETKLNLLNKKVEYAYQIRDMEMLHDALFAANQLDPLTPYYYAQEAIITFFEAPDTDETRRLIHLMRMCDMPQNKRYCDEFEGALILLSGQIVTSWKYSNALNESHRSFNALRPSSSYDLYYMRRLKNIKHLDFALDFDEDQLIALLYLNFFQIESSPGIIQKNLSINAALPDSLEMPGWFQAYYIYWSAKPKEYSISQNQLQMCLKEEPNNVVALTFSAYFYLKSGEYQSALDAAEIAEQYSPYCANAIWFKAVALYELGRHEEAREAVVAYNRICKTYEITSRQKFIRMGKKMLKECGIEI